MTAILRMQALLNKALAEQKASEQLSEQQERCLRIQLADAEGNVSRLQQQLTASLQQFQQQQQCCEEQHATVRLS